MMDTSELVRMANQIADFYRPYPHDEAVAGIAEHIRSFWEPRMRHGLSEMIKSGGAGLNDLALAGAKSALGLQQA
jgi:formate dehydrogenase subunit delta